MKASDVMTSNPVSVSPETTIAEAARLMLEKHISGLPVTNAKGAVVGVVTEGDLLRRAETGTERHRSRWLELLVGPGRLAADYVETHARKVGEAMTSEPVSVAPDDALGTVVQLMEKRRIKRVPVVDNGRLVGIISRADLVRALLHTLTREAAAATKPRSDDEIRSDLLAVIDKEPWGPRFSIEVTVKARVVDLNGTVTDDRERTAVVVAAENVPGVKAVHDRLVWIEPNSGLVVPAEGDLP
jgi:CBS domain-containing protein